MHLLKKHTAGQFIAAFLVFLLVSCPWLRSAQAFSIGEEKEVGEKMLALIRKGAVLVDEPDIVQYINQLGRRILKTTGAPQYFDFQFFVINDKEFNAFAAPSGLIFIHTGLIEATENEDELVSVIAHEIGHIASRHIAEQIEKSSKASIGTAAMILAGIALGGGPLAGALISGSLAANASMGLYFSRQHEEEADRLAFGWMQALNRNPLAMGSMLEKMRKISQYSMGSIPPYLLTHPEPAARLGYVQDLLITQPKKTYSTTDEFNFNRFKRRILALSKYPDSLIPRYLKTANDSEADPATRAMAYYGLSQVYAVTAEYTMAKQALTHALEGFPNQPILLADLGNILFLEGKYDEAQRILEKAKNAEPDNPYTAFYLAKCLEQQGNTKAALAIYEKLLSVQPAGPRLHYQIGQIENAQGYKPLAYFHLGLYFWYKGDAANAKFHFTQTVKALPANDPVRKQAEEMLATIHRVEKN